MVWRDGGLGLTSPPSRNIETADPNHRDNRLGLSERRGRPIGIAIRQHGDLRPEASGSPA
ncbi:hypothetical protein [Tannerella forsythia]